METTTQTGWLSRMPRRETIRADAVVIGAGLGGLSAAGYLASAGRKVAVLEHHTVPGGYAHEFKRRGFRFEVALHALDGAGRGGWLEPMLDDLGVLDRVDFTEIDPFYTARFPDFEITVPADLSAYVRELKQAFPAEAAGIDGLFSAIGRVAVDIVRYGEDRRSGARPTPTEMIERYPDMAQAFSQDWQTFMETYLGDAQLQAVVSTLWGYFGLPPSKVSAGLFCLALHSYHTTGAWYPKGGSQAMSRAIVEGIVEHGGSVHFRNRVTSDRSRGRPSRRGRDRSRPASRSGRDRVECESSGNGGDGRRHALRRTRSSGASSETSRPCRIWWCISALIATSLRKDGVITSSSSRTATTSTRIMRRWLRATSRRPGW